MKNFVKRAIKKIDQLDTEQIVDILQSQSRELEMLENVLDTIEDGVILTDANLTINYANTHCPNLIPMLRLRSYEGYPLSKVIEDKHVLRYIVLSVYNRAEDLDNEFTFQRGNKVQTIAVTVFTYKMPEE